VRQAPPLNRQQRDVGFVLYFPPKNKKDHTKEELPTGGQTRYNTIARHDRMYQFTTEEDHTRDGFRQISLPTFVLYMHNLFPFVAGRPSEGPPLAARFRTAYTVY
jgi:hypothetical protein